MSLSESLKTTKKKKKTTSLQTFKSFDMGDLKRTKNNL